MKLTGENRSTGGKTKTCSSVTLSTKNPNWIEPVSNPGLRRDRPVANRLSYGTARYQQGVFYNKIKHGDLNVNT
jgi:hypothetical protein